MESSEKGEEKAPTLWSFRLMQKEAEELLSFNLVQLRVQLYTCSVLKDPPTLKDLSRTLNAWQQQVIQWKASYEGALASKARFKKKFFSLVRKYNIGEEGLWKWFEAEAAYRLLGKGKNSSQCHVPFHISEVGDLHRMIVGTRSDLASYLDYIEATEWLEGTGYVKLVTLIQQFRSYSMVINLYSS